MRDWVPDDSEHAEEGKATRTYVLVPQLRLPGGSYFNRLNIAGWADAGGGSYVCKTCKKQLRLSLSELLIFPLVKADTDLFQFSYVVPPHKAGGTFSNETCKESETKVLRNYELPTAIRVVERGKASTSEKEGGEVHEESGRPSPPPLAAREDVDREEVKKKVESLSPQMVEERYNYLLSRPIGELTDAEYSERLALLERLTEKQKKPEKD